MLCFRKNSERSCIKSAFPNLLLSSIWIRIRFPTTLKNPWECPCTGKVMIKGYQLPMIVASRPWLDIFRYYGTMAGLNWFFRVSICIPQNTHRMAWSWKRLHYESRQFCDFLPINLMTRLQLISTLNLRLSFTQHYLKKYHTFQGIRCTSLP